jgi:S1-C subfamily serine protease
LIWWTTAQPFSSTVALERRLGSPTAGSNSNLAYSPPSPSATSRNIDIPTLVRQAKPAVVQIVTLDQNNKPLKTGTGFFISADGDLLTNYHVIFDASSILAKTPSGAVYFLKGIVSVSPPADIALLQFYATDLPYLRLGSTTDAVEGQRVLVIGNPEGLEGTISDGIISAFRENRSMIQITAPISSGSSGSPVLDESGQVLGIAILISKEGQNLNFAISSESIREALSESSVITRSPSVPAASSTPSSTAVAKSTPSAIAPTQTPIAIGANWPDGRKLLHPDRFVKTRVVNVAANDTLKLRSGPGTSFKILAIADSRYGSVGNLIECQKSGIRPHLKLLGESTRGKGRRAGIYGQERFIYDPLSDTYRCPAHQLMRPRRLHPQRLSWEYVTAKGTCLVCQLRAFWCAKENLGVLVN